MHVTVYVYMQIRMASSRVASFCLPLRDVVEKLDATIFFKPSGIINGEIGNKNINATSCLISHGPAGQHIRKRLIFDKTKTQQFWIIDPCTNNINWINPVKISASHSQINASMMHTLFFYFLFCKFTATSY